MGKVNIAGRVLAGLAALVSLGSGLGMMFSPDSLLDGLSVVPDGVVGYSSLRGLIGGSQVAFGIVFAIAAFRGRADYIVFGVFYFSAVLLGRVTGLALDGVDPFAIRASVFASVFLLICLGSFLLLKQSMPDKRNA